MDDTSSPTYAELQARVLELEARVGGLEARDAAHVQREWTLVHIALSGLQVLALPERLVHSDGLWVQVEDLRQMLSIEGLATGLELSSSYQLAAQNEEPGTWIWLAVSDLTQSSPWLDEALTAFIVHGRSQRPQ